MKLPFKDFEEFANNSLRVDAKYDPLMLIRFVPDDGNDRFYSLIMFDLYKEMDIAFYYSVDNETQKSDFIGCSLSSDEYPINLGWSDIVLVHNEQRIQRVLVDNVTFYRIDDMANLSTPDGSLRWNIHKTLLLYGGDSSVMEGWGAFKNWIGKNFYFERDVGMYILEDRTTRIETPDIFMKRQTELRERQTELRGLIHATQVIIGFLVILLIIYLIVEKRKELGRWMES